MPTIWTELEPEPGDADSETRDYRFVISRDGPWWVGTLYGPGAPESGETAKARSLKQLETAVDDLMQGHTVLGHSYVNEDGISAPCTIAFGYYTDYDFGPAANAALGSFREADNALIQATEDYNRHGHQAATMLARKHNATVAEIAEVLAVTRQEAARLLEPPARHRVHGWANPAKPARQRRGKAQG